MEAYWPEVTLFSEGRMVGEIANYTDLSFNYKWRGVSSATIQVPGVPLFLTEFTDIHRRWIDVVIEGPIPWTGHLTDTNVIVDEQKGVHTELTVAGSKAVLNGLRIYPSPSADLDNQGESEAYKLTAPARTAFETVVGQAASRQGVPIAIAGADDNGAFVGGDVTIEARMDPVLDTLEKVLTEQAMGVTAFAYYPGLGFVDEGYAPGTVVVDLVAPRDNPRVQWRQEDLSKGELKIKHATAGQLVVGGDGSGKDRKYLSTTDQDVSSAMGHWGGLQSYVDASSQQSKTGDAAAPASDPLTDARTLKAWREVSGATSVSMTAPDGQPYVFGRDYLLGDLVTGEVAGVTARAQITEVEVKVDLGSVKVTPKIGEASASPLTSLVNQVADLAREDERRKRWR